MLRGIISVDGHDLDVRGYDIGGGFNFIAENNGQGSDAFRYWAEDELDRWEQVNIGIGEARAAIGRLDGNKWKPKTLNRDAVGIIASVYRELKNRCNSRTIVDSDGTSRTYKVEGDWGSAKIKLVAGDVIKFQGSGILDEYDWVFDLEDDGTYEEKVYKPNNGVSFNIELGWSTTGVEVGAEVDYLALSTEADFFTLEELQSMHPERDYAWLKGADYVIADKSNIEDIVAQLQQAVREGKYIAFDTETTGLNIRFKSVEGEGDHCVGLVFSIKEGQGWYIPVRMNTFANIWQDSKEDSWSWGIERETVRKYFKGILENGRIVGHNTSFDWKVAWTYGINTNFVHDTLMALKLGYANEHRGKSIGLKPAAKELLGRDSLSLGDIARNGNWAENDFADLPYETVRLYACADTDNTLSLLHYMEEHNHFGYYGLDNQAYKIEVGFTRVTGYQEYYGHHINMEKVADLRNDIQEGKAKAEAKMVEIAGKTIKWSSSVQLQKLMYDELGYPVLGYTKAGGRSTDKRVLKRLAEATNENDEPLYPFAAALREYKAWDQLQVNFVNALDRLGTSDGFMFSEVKPPLETGRVAVANPNYQSYNDTVKKYVSPRRGYYMMDMDYSSVEYRILASMSGQENLIKAFYNPDTDYHTYQASRMFNVPYELVSSKLRHDAKGVNFGLPYGMGDASLGAHIYGEKTQENTRRAADLRKKYFEGQEKVEKFFIDARRNSWEKSYAEDFFGRRRYFDKRIERRDTVEREGGNMAIQGTAADIFKLGMIRLFKEISNRGWLGKFLIVAFVHDEALYEVANEIEPTDVLALIEWAVRMEDVTERYGWAPLYLGGGYGENWYHAKKTEMPIELQDEVVEEYSSSWKPGEKYVKDGKGIPWWNGDINRLYAWEVEKNNQYYAERIHKYLTTGALSKVEPGEGLEGLNGKTVNPQVASYARDLLGYLNDVNKKIDDTEREGHRVPEFIEKGLYQKWWDEGHKIGDSPVETMSICARLLGVCDWGITDYAEQIGLKNLDKKKMAEAEEATKDSEVVGAVVVSAEDKDVWALTLKKLQIFRETTDANNMYIYMPYKRGDDRLNSQSTRQFLGLLRAYMNPQESLGVVFVFEDGERLHTKQKIGYSAAEFIKSQSRHFMPDPVTRE